MNILVITETRGAVATIRLPIRQSKVEQRGRSLHSLRHTFARREYYRTGDTYHVKERLGHSAVAVTGIYLRFPQQYLKGVFGSSVTQQSTADCTAAWAAKNPPFKPDLAAQLDT